MNRPEFNNFDETGMELTFQSDEHTTHPIEDLPGYTNDTIFDDFTGKVFKKTEET